MAEQWIDLFFKIILATYTILLPLVLKYIIELIKEEKKKKKESHEKWESAVEELTGQVKTLTKTVEDNNAMTSRYRIIRFDDEVRQNGYQSVSADHVDQILEEINTYKAYCNTHPDFVNHKGQNAMRRIIEADQKGYFLKNPPQTTGGAQNV